MPGRVGSPTSSRRRIRGAPLSPMLQKFIREAGKLDWAQRRLWTTQPCLITIALALLAGVLTEEPTAGMIAAGGAMAVGFGAFQRLGRSHLAPMLAASVGMGISALGGSLVGHSGPGAVLNAGWAGFGCGMLLALGPGASWVGQQCGIAALVASGYPAGTTIAVQRALLILAGGLGQTLVMAVAWRLRAPRPNFGAAEDPFQGWRPALRTLRENLTPRAEACRYGLRLGVTLAVAAGLADRVALSNGYWVPMTALLVLRNDFQQTFQRSLLRIAGTLVGAGLATHLVAVGGWQPGPAALSVLVVVFAWLAYALVNVNYGVFAVALTSYIVFLLGIAGLPTREVAAHRTANTALGGGLALLSFSTGLWVRGRPRAGGTRRDPGPSAG